MNSGWSRRKVRKVRIYFKNKKIGCCLSNIYFFSESILNHLKTKNWLLSEVFKFTFTQTAQYYTFKIIRSAELKRSGGPNQALLLSTREQLRIYVEKHGIRCPSGVSAYQCVIKYYVPSVHAKWAVKMDAVVQAC